MVKIAPSSWSDRGPAPQKTKVNWDESQHPRHPAGAPQSQGGEFAEGGGGGSRFFKKDKASGRFTTQASAATRLARKAGILAQPRSHKKKSTVQDVGAMPPKLKVSRSGSVAKAVTRAAGDFAAIGASHAIRAASGGTADVQFVRKSTGGKPRSSGHDWLDTSDNSGYGTAPPRVPTHYSKNDEKGYKVQFYVGKVTKKRRPTFPQGYRKPALDF